MRKLLLNSLGAIMVGGVIGFALQLPPLLAGILTAGLYFLAIGES